MIEFITDTFKSQCKDIIKSLFYNLNNDDIILLLNYTEKIINHIANCYNFEKKNIYYKHFLKNNGQDIKSLVLQLIPFIKKFDFNNLDQIIYNDDKKYIDKKILDENINNIINTKFKYSNFALGLINENKDKILELYTNNNRLIEDIIYYNYRALKETITVTNGKLYVNWLNVFPMIDYKNTPFYKKSIEELRQIQYNSLETVNNYGLWFGDYYNVIRNGYYESIKKIKWVIYNKKINNESYYYIQYLTRLFNFKQLFEYNNFNDMDETEQIIFSNKINTIIQNLKNNISNFKSVSIEKDIFKNIISFLVNNSNYRFLLKKEHFNKFYIDLETVGEDLDKNEIQINEINDNDIYIALSNIEPKILWNYLKQVLIELKVSIYGSYLVKNNRIDNNFFNFPMDEDDGIINLKNIYNIAKILSHNKDFILLGSNYKNLEFDTQKRFFRQYFNLRINLRNNIKYQEEDNYNYNNVIRNIINGWNKIKVFLIWNYLSYNGLLSEFKVMLELTDSSLLPISTKEKRNAIQRKLKDYFNENKKIFKSNYFLTNDTYFNLNKYNYTNDNLKIEYYESLCGYKNNKYIPNNLIHYTFYGNDYVSQLNIFNHYINHQIIYVTGGTGTGKSTQVPKLLLYCLKMYDYKNNGKTICTQPRISPTEGNAKRISDELGVSIMINNIKTNNYYLQYKDQKDQHTKENCEHLTLRFVTDGTLLEELVSNPYMKEKVKKGKDDYIYSINNKFDIIIIDEAHEHNTNMDLILTLMRQTCFLNNSVRLVIISATMDDDEPIYRSYFKYINDNIVYPIKQPLIDNEGDLFLVESFYLDRRLDISIPGQTTQYNIDEIYVDLKISNNHRIDSINAQKEAYKYIDMITKKYDNGEILLFSTGKAEIIEAVNYLNSILPSGNIALPFYSEMNPKYREIIEKIGTKISFIQNKRNNIALEWGSEYKNVKDVPIGTYKRAVIVATNVAEASITIDTLKIVVDTGYEKVSMYDSNMMTSVIVIEPISEASRLQRKGRVGRTNDGTVYYMYKKGARERIKPKYKITNDDFHLSFLKLLNNSVKQEDPQVDMIILNELSPYAVADFINNFKLINEFEYLKLTYFYNKNLYTIYEKQYLNEGEIDILLYFSKFNYFYGGNGEFFDPDYKIPSYLNKLESGFLENQLFDEYGELYIIHPFEKDIIRNINNKIISYNKKKQNNIELNDFTDIIKNMEFKLEYLNMNIKSNDIKFIDGRKTIYGTKILEIPRIIPNITESNSISLLIASGYNIQFEMIQILSLLDVLNGSILSLAMKNVKNKNIQEYDNFLKKFKGSSDLLTIYKIIKIFDIIIKKMNIYKLYTGNGSNNSNIFINFKNKIKMFKKFNINITNLNNIPIELKKDWNILNWLKENGKLNDDGYLYYIYTSDEFKEYIYNDYNKNEIKRLCYENFIDYKKIELYFENLFNYIKSIISAERDMEQDFNEESPFKWINNISSTLQLSLIENNLDNKIINSFLLSNPLNIAININNEYRSINKYMKVDFRKIFNNIDTFNYGISNYVYYNNIKLSNNNDISIIHNIDPKILAMIFPLHYNKNFIKNNYTFKAGNIYKNLTINSLSWEIFINKILNNNNFNYFPFNGMREYLPIISNYINMIKKN